jgi:hypothetical protein
MSDKSVSFLDYLQQYPNSEKLYNIFQEDCQPINAANITQRLSDYPLLYSKYHSIYQSIHDAYRIKSYEKEILRSRLARYYNGTSYEHEKKINPDLIVKGKTNTELNRAIDSEYISYLNEISKLEDLKVYITRILDFVKFQGNHLKTCADQIRFADGAFR